MSPRSPRCIPPAPGPARRALSAALRAAPALFGALACQAPGPPAAAPPAPLVFVRADGRALYDQLGRSLPADLAQREAVCLAGLAQARMLADEPDPRVQQRARRWRIDCRQALVEQWVARAEAAPQGERRAAACLSARGYLAPLARDDAQRARGLEALVSRACAAPIEDGSPGGPR